MARDLERNLGAICSVARNTRCGAMRTNQSRAVEDALRFFAGARATAHEEYTRRIIPALASSAAINAAVADTLLAMYREAASYHTIVDRLGLSWLEHGALPTNDGIEMRAALERLQNTYARLLPAEQADLYAALDEDGVTETLHGAKREDG